MQNQITKLRELTREYRTYDDELRTLNAQVYGLRETRKGVEVLMIDILKQDGFNEFKHLKLEDDGSVIKIQRPQTWSKPFSLSQSELKGFLEVYFDVHKLGNGEDCFNYIVQEKKADIVSNEFAITRTVAK